MTIQEASELTGLSQYTLRFYEKIGLFESIRRDASGYRDFTKSDLEAVDFVQKLKTTGMPIQDIRTYIALMKSGEVSYRERLEMLMKHKRRIEERIKTDTAFLDSIEYKIEEYKKYRGVLGTKE